MSMIRLEHKNLQPPNGLDLLRERLLNVVPADADAGGDQRSTTCSQRSVRGRSGWRGGRDCPRP